MKNLIYLIVFLGIALVNVSCDAVFEPNIDNKQVSIVAPGDSVKSPTYAVTFWWNPTDNALKYNLQIVAPDFNHVTAFVLDTMVSSTKFIYSLNPGIYQWRLRAENGSSKTAYTTRTLVVDTSGLNNQPMYVTAPSNNVYSNSYSVPFSWQPMWGTSAYIIEIDTITGNFSGALKCNMATPYSGYTFNFGNDGAFQWRVKATNASQVSSYSDVRNIYIDRTKPASISNLYPASGTLDRPIALSWDACTSPDVVKYRVYVYNQDYTVFSQDMNPREVISGTSFSFNTGLSGKTMFWRVTAVDRAGNESDYSPYGTFVIGF